MGQYDSYTFNLCTPHLWAKYYYDFCFKDEKHEAQRLTTIVYKYYSNATIILLINFAKIESYLSQK